MPIIGIMASQNSPRSVTFNVEYLTVAGGGGGGGYYAANPYGGSNTAAIPSGYTKLLLVP